MALSVAGALADDGEMTNKRMTGGSIDNQLTVLPEDVGLHISEPEHAYTQFMPFYVPSQRASGLVEAIEYFDVDDLSRETLAVARPLINVFVYGPLLEVEGTAFAHSWMDAFAAVSLDDGETWKTTNLSEAADQSSFNLITGGGQGGGGEGGGGCSVDEDGDDEGGGGCGHGGLSIEIDSAIWSEQNKNFGKLQVIGEGDPKEKVSIINFDTGEQLFALTAANKTGLFDVTRNVRITKAPCRIAAVASGETSSPVPVAYPDGSAVECTGLDIVDYPGGAHNIVHVVAGNRAMVAWPSRYCQQGQPGYSFAWRGEDKEADIKPELIDRRNALIEHLGVDIYSDLYLTDLFGVAGAQRSSNFEEEGYPQVGEVPFSCLWTARGVLRPGDDPRTEENVESSHMVWTKPERLTSGRRDVNRVEIDAKQGVGFAITWQEDPDGLRPGQGEGPGEGWSGAIAHPKTDTWYSFIPWDQFAWVESPEDALIKQDIFDYLLPSDPNATEDASGRPQVYVPMALPVRLTNNDKCVPDKFAGQEADEEFGYCNGVVAAQYGLQDFCATTVEVPQGQQGELGLICVNEDGLPNLANTASTRARFSLQAYDGNGDTVRESGWIILSLEESKGLGRYTFLPDGSPCTLPPPGQNEDPGDPDCSADIGKNQWYFSFDMGRVKSSTYMSHPNSLVQSLVTQGHLLNQPEIDWRTGEFYPAINTSEMWNFTTNFDIYNTEIARRGSLMVQPVAKAANSTGGLAALPLWKQGTMRQGGPADIMTRRIVMPDGFTEGLENNPYSFANVECVQPDGETSGWILQDGSNPYYPGGICAAPAINLSATIPDTCVDTGADDTATGAVACPAVDFTTSTFGIGDTNPILQGYIQQEGNTQKVLTWHQCPSDGVQTTGDFTSLTCTNDNRPTDPFKTAMRDQSWYNPLDVAKGHRGFLDGDFVMLMYAWSPNWRLNAKGSDRYDLYVRRSFDGGQTWTTTPTTGEASDGMAFGGEGTVSCQIYRSEETGLGGGDPEPKVCFAYGVGVAEAARNLTQHERMKTTTLDPRYSPTGGGLQVSIVEGCTNGLLPANLTSSWTCDDTSTIQEEDLRDPSRYFIVYETGDNSTAAEGEPEPLDLFYARAEGFGDHYTVWAETDTASADLTVCYPSDPHDPDAEPSPVTDSGFCNEFDRMTTGSGVSASESSLTATPGGGKLYGVWTQIVEDDDGEEADAMARRVWWLDGFISLENAWTLPGTNKEE